MEVENQGRRLLCKRAGFAFQEKKEKQSWKNGAEPTFFFFFKSGNYCQERECYYVRTVGFGTHEDAS